MWILLFSLKLNEVNLESHVKGGKCLPTKQTTNGSYDIKLKQVLWNALKHNISLNVSQEVHAVPSLGDDWKATLGSTLVVGEREVHVNKSQQLFYKGTLTENTAK